MEPILESFGRLNFAGLRDGLGGVSRATERRAADSFDLESAATGSSDSVARRLVSAFVPRLITGL